MKNFILSLQVNKFSGLIQRHLWSTNHFWASNDIILYICKKVSGPVQELKKYQAVNQRKNVQIANIKIKCINYYSSTKYLNLPVQPFAITQSCSCLISNSGIRMVHSSSVK